MATVLLIIIYIAFIGLGIPDSLFGTAWPAIYSDFGLPFSFGSFVTVIVSCGTVISSIISSKVIAKLGTNKVSAYSTLLTAIALLGYSFAPNLWVMCFLSVILGIGAGSIDVALNNYVALHYSPTHMSFLHCFYGVGVSVSPYILSLVIAGKSGWRGGYRITFIIQLAIAALLFISLPLWHKVFYPQLGVKLCSMAGGGVQKIYMVLLREPSRRDRSGSDLFHLRDGFEIKMNFDRNVSCFIFVNALMHDDFLD